MRRLLFDSLLGLIGAAAIAVPGWMVMNPPRPAPAAPPLDAEVHTPGTSNPAPPPQELARLRTMAETACKCARASRDKAGADACWQAFDRKIAPHLESSTMCDPLSESSRCFDGDICVTTKYSIGGSNNSGGEDFCTLDEARAAEELFHRAADGRGGDAGQNRDEALRQLSKQFARGRRVAHAEPIGCAGRGG